MKIRWTQHGAPRERSIAVPPLPSLIDGYVLDYDSSREQVVYLCRPADDGAHGLELHAFDGAQWSCVSRKRAEFHAERLEGGGYDPARGAVIGWGFETDHGSDDRHKRVVGVAFTSSGAKRVATRGELPIIEPENEDDEIGTFDKEGAFVFDRDRRVWVCLTRRGVWELAPDDAWTRGSDGGGLIPQDWRGETGTGVYDPVGRRAAFIVQDDRFKMVVLGWDGRRLERLPLAGLPRLTDDGLDPTAQLVGHARHGLVLHAGAGRLFALSGARWTALPTASDPPPVMADACMTFDARRDAIVLGPGKHRGAGGSDRNGVFFVLRGGRWERQGVAKIYAPIQSASYGNVRMCHAGGAWYALGTHSLRTWAFRENAWRELVKKDAGEKVGGWEPQQLVAANDVLHAVTASGRVFRFDGARWTARCKKNPAFKDRTDFALAADANGHLVVWGGEAKGRKLNDTFVFDGKAWRAVKKSSPRPADFKHGRKDGVYVDTTMVYDTALGALVRFGYEGAAVQQPDGTWKETAPRGYKPNVSSRAWGHVPVHDPTTGETLLVDFAGDVTAPHGTDPPGRIVRFDLGGCELVATIELPPELARTKRQDPAPYHTLAASFSYDPASRALYAQTLEDRAGVYRLDLADVFAHARTLGPRTIPTAPRSASPRAIPKATRSPSPRAPKRATRTPKRAPRRPRA